VITQLQFTNIYHAVELEYVRESNVFKGMAITLMDLLTADVAIVFRLPLAHKFVSRLLI